MSQNAYGWRPGHRLGNHQQSPSGPLSARKLENEFPVASDKPTCGSDLANRGLGYRPQPLAQVVNYNSRESRDYESSLKSLDAVGTSVCATPAADTLSGIRCGGRSQCAGDRAARSDVSPRAYRHRHRRHRHDLSGAVLQSRADAQADRQ